MATKVAVKGKEEAGFFRKLWFLTDHHSLEPVPRSERRNWFETGISWIGLYICIPNFITGALIMQGLQSWTLFAIAVGVGLAINLVLTSLQGVISSRTGLNTSVMTRACYGMAGSYLMSILTALTSLTWFALHIEIIGKIGYSTWGIQPWIASVVVGCCMIFTAYNGYRGIALLSWVAIPFMTIVMIYAGSKYGSVEITQQILSGAKIPLLAAISMTSGMLLQGGPDIYRFDKGDADTVGGVLWTYVGGFCFVFIIGALLILGSGTADLVYVLIKLAGWGVLAALFILLAEWTSNDNNLYMTALAANNILKLKRLERIIVVGGVIGTIVGLFGLLKYILTFMVLLSVTVLPCIAVAVADYWIYPRRKNLKEMHASSFLAANPSALIAWACGSAVGLFYKGGVQVINAVVVSVVVYVILMAVWGKKWTQQQLLKQPPMSTLDPHNAKYEEYAASVGREEPRVFELSDK